MTRRIAEQIRVRLIGDDFAFVSLVCDGWSIHGIRVTAFPDDTRIEWPFREDKGERFPVATPPPEIRDQLEQEIVEAYDQAIARRRR